MTGTPYLSDVVQPGVNRRLGGFAREGEGRRGRYGRLDGNRVVAPVAVAAAGVALLFDVVDFAAGRNLAVLADHTTASEGGEAKKPDQAHHTYLCLSNSRTRASEFGRLRFL